MREIPYLGLQPFSEENAPFFFGRDNQTRAIARSLKVSRLTLLFGESGVGKSSILGAGVIPLLHQGRNSQSAVVLFRDWHSKNPLQDLLEKIKDSVAQAMGIKPTALEEQATPIESLKEWTKILGEEQERGQLFIILDQFEEYFQYHPQEFGENTFADEFPRWVNSSDLRVNFLIAIRQDSLANLYRFQDRILNIFDNQIELKPLDQTSAQDAIVKPIREYNLRRIVADYFQTSQLTVLSGASGMGKSRVLEAIAEDLIKESISFQKWHGNPVTNLVWQINTDLKKRFPDISVPKSRTSLTETLQWWIQHIAEKGEENQFFIILDQFEEFFQCQDPKKEGGIFIAEFSHAMTNPELPVHFLIAIRDEALDLLKHFQESIPNIFDHLLEIKQLGEHPEISDLVKPIEEPAQYQSKAIDIEPILVEEVLNQVAVLSQDDLIGTAGSKIRRLQTSPERVTIEAPLLQLVMERLWKEEVDNKHSNCLRLMTLKALIIPEKNISGAERIVNDHLNAQMEDLSDKQQYAMAIVFKYLVSAEGSKIAYPVLKLPEPTGLNITELRSVLDQLDAKRILRTVKIPQQSDESYYEIFHDILASPIIKWREQYLQDKKLKEEEKQRNRKIWQRIRIGVTATLSITVVGIYTLIYVPQRNNQIKLQEAAEYNRQEAMKIFNSELKPSGQIAGLLMAIQLGKELSNSKSLIKDLDTMLKNIHEKNILQVEQAALLSISFSPNGKLFATGANNGYVYLWTLEGKKQKEFTVSQAPVISVNFSPDGQFIATLSNDNIIRLWNLEGKKQTEFLVSKAPVISVNFSPDGQFIATVSNDNIIRLWNLEGKKQTEFLISTTPVISVNFSPGEKLMATVSNDNIVRLWTLEGKQQGEFRISQAPVMSVSFSADGKLMATVSDDNMVRLWNLEGKKQTEFPVPSTLIVRTVSFSPDGKFLATVSDDGLVRLWNIQKKASQFNNNDLNKLLKMGCNWLKEYFETHPQDKEHLSSICENK